MCFEYQLQKLGYTLFWLRNPAAQLRSSLKEVKHPPVIGLRAKA